MTVPEVSVGAVTQALYRRYRPESFADVIGQEHVTAPLIAALTAGKVNHAYLFSGPRGCGKTTSARILSRCLNCEQGPTATPCGVCPSCTDLARGAAGSLDVVEIDAASHGGVDDARELRERATIGPARDRYKVYVIDEAHMVTTAGFNALLKLVEEPPEYVCFVFATTEPDKVLQTIRSRTHHYSFRLVPPQTLSAYLEQLCAAEGVHVGKGVIPLVVRAGAGSVRDSLSVLDQLMAGAGPQGVDYPLAVALLGYTDSALLDEVVGALGQVDGAALFGIVDRVIQSGHDPRRFAEDLLERLRDLIVLQAMGDSAAGVLRAVPKDQLERMQTQSSYLGQAELSRAADVVNTALGEMVGASSPRMHLELLCARLLLPAVDPGERGLGPRLERIERRLGAGSAARLQTAPQTAPRTAPQTALQTALPTAQPAATGPSEPGPSEPGPSAAPGPAAAAPASTPWPPDVATGQQPSPAGPAPEPAPAEPASTDTAPEQPVATADPAPGALDTEAMRRMWPDLLHQVQGMKRSTWMIISANAQVHDLAGGVLRLAFSNQGTARGFGNGQHAEVVAAAVEQLLGVAVRVEAVAGSSPSSAPLRAVDGSPWPGAAPTPPAEPPDWFDPTTAPPPTAEGPGAAPTAPARRSRAEQMAQAQTPRGAVEPDTPRPDDPDLEDHGPAGTSVVEQLLGGQVIDVEHGAR